MSVRESVCVCVCVGECVRECVCECVCEKVYTINGVLIHEPAQMLGRSWTELHRKERRSQTRSTLHQ